VGSEVKAAVPVSKLHLEKGRDMVSRGIGGSSKRTRSESILVKLSLQPRKELKKGRTVESF